VPRSREVSDPAQASASFRGERDPPHPFHATDACGQFGTQEAGVGRLVRHAPDGSEPKVDRGGRISALLKLNPIVGQQCG